MVHAGQVEFSFPQNIINCCCKSIVRERNFLGTTAVLKWKKQENIFLLLCCCCVISICICSNSSREMCTANIASNSVPRFTFLWLRESRSRPHKKMWRHNCPRQLSSQSVASCSFFSEPHCPERRPSVRRDARDVLLLLVDAAAVSAIKREFSLYFLRWLREGLLFLFFWEQPIKCS